MADLITIGIIVLCVAGAIWYKVKLKKEGKSGCGCGCEGCSSSSSCGIQNKTEKR